MTLFAATVTFDCGNVECTRSSSWWVDCWETLHEIQDGGEVIRRKDKEPLPIFGGNLEVDTLRESLLTAGDTSQFFGDKFIEKTNLHFHGMQSRTVRVADATKSISGML